MKFIILTLFILSCADQSERQLQTRTDSTGVTTDSIQYQAVPRSIRIGNIRYDIYRLQEYEADIKKYATRNNLDWRLVVAMILKESGFDEDAVSRVGAKGLMQIMPETGAELGQKLRMEYLYERPDEHLNAGTYYLKQKIEMFDFVPIDTARIKIGIAAYNSGQGRLFDAIRIARYYYPDDPYNWDHISWALKRLNPRFYQMHLKVWPAGKPTYGYFKNAREPITYVNRIWEIYQQLKQFYPEPIQA